MLKNNKHVKTKIRAYIVNRSFLQDKKKKYRAFVIQSVISMYNDILSYLVDRKACVDISCPFI